MYNGHSINGGRNLAVIQPTTIDYECARIVLDEIKLDLRATSRKVDVQTGVRLQVQVVARERRIHQAAGRGDVHVAQAEQNIEIEAAVREQRRRRVAAAR